MRLEPGLMEPGGRRARLRPVRRRFVVHVTLRDRPSATPRHHVPAPEHAGPAEQHEQNHAAAGAPLISSILAATGAVDVVRTDRCGLPDAAEFSQSSSPRRPPRG